MNCDSCDRVRDINEGNKTEMINYLLTIANPYILNDETEIPVSKESIAYRTLEYLHFVDEDLVEKTTTGFSFQFFNFNLV